MCDRDRERGTWKRVHKTCPGSTSVVVGRASSKMMQRDVRRGRWKDFAGDERDGLWRSCHGPSGQDPKDERKDVG